MALLLVLGLTCVVSEVMLDAPKPSVGEGNSDDTKNNKHKKETLKATKLPPCASCRVLTDSFKKVTRDLGINKRSCFNITFIRYKKIENYTHLYRNAQGLKKANLCYSLQGIESTSRGKYEGGDSAWEEEKLLSYKKSEVRLIEIQEKLCKDVERGKNQVRWC